MRRITIRRGETVTVTRVTRDGSSDSPAPAGSVTKTAFGKEEALTPLDDHGGRRTIVERNWFCHRGSDVQAGDRISRANGETYSVIAGPFGDVDHPLSGSDLGVMKFRLRRVAAPRG